MTDFRHRKRHPSIVVHVSAYVAIFKCVGFFYFRIPEGICFASFTCTYSFRNMKIKISYTPEDGL
jgi:hypothetical protein